jgi:hypothetical protein
MPRTCQKENVMETEKADDLKPPYLPFQTFLSFIEELASKPLPPQIDRSMMSSKSGTDQANLFSALKFFGLIDKGQAVQEGLTLIASSDEEGRRRAIGGLLRAYYPKQFAVSEQNGTEKLLLDSIEADWGYTGDTRRKAMTFFLHGARWAGLELSAHFPQTRMGSGRSTAPRPKRAPKKKPDGAGSNPNGQGQSGSGGGEGGEIVNVSLGSAGSIRVDVRVKWLELDDDTFADLRRIVKELRALSIEEPDQGVQEGVSTP